VANGASRFGVRQLLAAFRLLELERPVECASADALSAKTVPRHFPVSPICPNRQSGVPKSMTVLGMVL
jgi:hypothetical protein